MGLQADNLHPVARRSFQFKDAVLTSMGILIINIRWSHYHLRCIRGTHVPGKTALILKQQPGPWFNVKMPSYQYRKSHCGDKTILWSSYLHNGISYTCKMTSLYRITAQHWSILSVMCSLNWVLKPLLMVPEVIECGRKCKQAVGMVYECTNHSQ